MDENEILKPKSVDKWVHIIITQAICITVILLAVLVTKYFFGDCYNAMKEWYTDNICVETDVSEVTGSLQGDADEV